MKVSCALDPNILRTHEWHLCDTSCNTSHLDSGRYSGDKCASSSWSQYTADTCLAFMWILSLDKARFYSRGDLSLHCPWSRPFCLLNGCLVYAFVFFFFFFFFLFCFVFQYEVCVLRCLSRLYTVYLSPFLYLSRLPISRMRNHYQYRFWWIIFSETYLCKI